MNQHFQRHLPEKGMCGAAEARIIGSKRHFDAIEHTLLAVACVALRALPAPALLIGLGMCLSPEALKSIVVLVGGSIKSFTVEAPKSRSPSTRVRIAKATLPKGPSLPNTSLNTSP